jgi:hypothetical protein
MPTLNRIGILTMNYGIARQLRAQLWKRYVLAISRNFTEALLSEALTTEEKAWLTTRIYNTFPNYPGGARPPWGEKLAPWEETWFGRRLPTPPSRILLGACGAGREALALLEMGFEVDAFDLAAELTSIARQTLGNRARVLTLGYEDLSAAVLEGKTGPATSLVQERYEAVLLGWGSLTHVMDPNERLRLLRSLTLICPSGPILASFWCTNGYSPQNLFAGAQAFGQAIGSKVAKLRGISAEVSRQKFLFRVGFGYVFTPEEIEGLGASVSRNVLWECDDTNYAVSDHRGSNS